MADTGQAVTFHIGASNNLPQTITPGSIYVESDTGVMSIDADSSSRIEIKDSTKLPLAGGTVNGWLKVDGTLSLKGDDIDTADVCIANGHSYDAVGKILFGTDVIGGSPVVLSNVYDPSDRWDAANKNYVDQKCLVFQNIVVEASAFVADSTISGYSYRASIPLSGVTASYVPYVTFSAADANSGIYANVSQTYAGGVYIYANAQPSSDMTILSISCLRGDQ